MRDSQLFYSAVAKQFDRMQKYELFRTGVAKEELWDTYIKSFPPGSNVVLNTRSEYDCNVCKGFIRQAGSMIAIIDGKVETLWDGPVKDEAFTAVTEAMAKLVRSKPIENFYLHVEKRVGQEKTHGQDKNKEIVSFNHFCVHLPNAVVVTGDQIGPKLSDYRSTKDVMLRSLNEIKPDAVEAALELIAQNSLYRGEEHKASVVGFQKLQNEFRKLKTDEERELFCWSRVKSVGAPVSRIRNTSIGSLLVDISEGKDLDHAVGSFEQKVAPTNYKRPTAVVTKGMIAKAQKVIDELGLAPALDRRYAKVEDITVNNILFVERSTKKLLKGNVFEDLASQVKENTKTFDRLEEIGIEDFLAKVLPKAESLEVLLENKHSPNLVSLVAPVDPNAKRLFKWDNNFSWSYTGDMTDSIKERVKRAGGRVEGDLRCSLSWYNLDDLDLHMVEPNGGSIYFGNKTSHYSRGTLDVDMNAGMGRTRTPVENIIYPERRTMPEGIYTLRVNNYMKRETVDVGFEVECEFDGQITTMVYDKAVANQAYVEVMQLKYSKKDGFKIIKSLPSTATSKELWGISSQKFHRVNVAMLSPNYWDDKPIGNKHYFFMLEGCRNEGKARGFFNEFLSEDLSAHRKVLEMVGAKMKTDEAEHQLSGLGFSSTQRNQLVARVQGQVTRNLKINF